MPEPFRNWSGSLRFTPGELTRPRDEQEVLEVVQRARADGRSVRPVGEGHSSVPLMATEDVLMSLETMSGLVSADPAAGRATLLPGTTLERTGVELAAAGLAMENLGDVDLQSLAGAFGTGTHGSGITLGNLPTTLTGGRLVTGTGEVVPFGEDAGPDHDEELLRAVRLNLGALGVLTSMTLRVVPAFDLHRVNWCTHVDWVLDHLDELVERNRCFDFYWYPRSDLAQVRTMNIPVEEPASDLTPPGHVHTEETGPSHEVIPNHRDLRFDEMEYMLPLDAGAACFREVRERVRERHRQRVGWRVLVRTVAADDTLISNCHGRPTMTIALLHNAELPHDEYFGDLEPLLQEFGGRPHWGKKHSMTADELAPLYPGWDTFLAVRERLDPDGVLLNDYLRQLLGVPA